MFDNSLYYTSKTRPQSTSSDPETRAPMPLPEPCERKSDLFTDDPVIYHDVDEQTLLKTDANAYATPQKSSQHDRETNAYANGHVVLDVRSHAGEGNLYEDFNALKHKADHPTPRAGYEDMGGYLLPSVAGSFKENAKPNGHDKAAILPKESVAVQFGYVNPVFQSDQTPETLQNADVSEDIQVNEIQGTDGEKRPLPTGPPVEDHPLPSSSPCVEEDYPLTSAEEYPLTTPQPAEEEYPTNIDPPVPRSNAGFYEEKELDDQETPDFLDDFNSEAKSNVHWTEQDESTHGTDNFSETEMLRTPEDAADHSGEDLGEADWFHDDDGLKFVGIRHDNPAEEDRLDLDSVGETATDDLDLPPPPPPSELIWQYPEYELAGKTPTNSGYF